MRQLVKMQFGSHVYGTNVPESDQDFKGIFIPSPKDIIMQKAAKTSINENTKLDQTKRNTKDDVDFENFSLHGFLKLIAEGQTVALDMMFTPDKFINKYNDHDNVFEWLRLNTENFVSIKSKAFTGYCYKQAAKYGLKGSRLNALESTIDFLKKFPTSSKLGDHADALASFVNTIEHAHIMPMDKTDKTGKVIMTEVYLEVCGRKAGYRASVNQAIGMYQHLYDMYGARAMLAKQNMGIDWKALMHAVRVCHEAIELLSTGKITFPRPEAPLLLQIRKGELSYDEVSEMIVRLLGEVTDAEEKSVLKPEPNYDLIDEIVYDTYRREVISYG